MKKIALLTFVFSIFIGGYGLAYTPSDTDQELLGEVYDRIDEHMEIDDYDTLLSMHEKLDAVIMQMEIRGLVRETYIMKMIQAFLIKHLFRYPNTCLEAYAQSDDTVYTTYTVWDSEGNTVRERTKQLVFNPGTTQLRYVLSHAPLGMQQESSRTFDVPSYPVKNDEGDLIIEKSRASLEEVTMTALEVGNTIMFGSTKVNGVFYAEIVAIEGDMITLDFGVSEIGQPAYVKFNLERFSKGCNEDTIYN